MESPTRLSTTTAMVSDILIAVSYFAIPLEIFFFQRTVFVPPKFQRLLWLFECFISFCGLTHMLSFAGAFVKVSVALSITKVLTAAISLATATFTFHLLPKLLTLESRNAMLEEELGLRLTQERQLVQANHLLRLLNRMTQRIRDSLNVDEIASVAVKEIELAIPDIHGVVLCMREEPTRVFQVVRSNFRIHEAQMRQRSLSAGQTEELEGLLESQSSMTSLTSEADVDLQELPTALLSQGSISGDMNPGEISQLMFSLDREPGSESGVAPFFEWSAPDSRKPVRLWAKQVDRERNGRSEIMSRPRPLIKVPVFRSGQFHFLKVGNDSRAVLLLFLSQNPALDVIKMHNEFLSYIVGQLEVAFEHAYVVASEKLRCQELEVQLQLNATLDREKQAAESHSKMKSEFLATMSHEIRTPMNAIVGMTSLLADQALSHEQKQIISVIQKGSHDLLTILNDILDFSKIESGNLKLEEEPFNLRSTIEGVLDFVSRTAETKGILLNLFLDPNLPHLVVGDATRLRQILNNLISNAIKFTDTGDIVVIVSASNQALPVSIDFLEDTNCYMYSPNYPVRTQTTPASPLVHSKRFHGDSTSLGYTGLAPNDASVSVNDVLPSSIRREGGWPSTMVGIEGNTGFGRHDAVQIYFNVIDTGVGIPSDSMGKLFKKFSQVSTGISRRYGGTGLGLAICCRLVEVQGGAMWVRSVHHKGSSFAFMLNLKCAPEGAVEKVDTVGYGSTKSLSPTYLEIKPAVSGNGLAIVIEPRRISSTAISYLLTGLGVDVEGFQNLTLAELFLSFCDRKALAGITSDCENPMWHDSVGQSSTTNHFSTRGITTPRGRFDWLVIIVSAQLSPLIDEETHPHLSHHPVVKIFDWKQVSEKNPLSVGRPITSHALGSAIAAGLAQQRSREGEVAIRPSTPIEVHQKSNSDVPSSVVRWILSFRVLVVDDNAVNRMVVAKLLERVGVTSIHAVSDGKEAVEWIQKQYLLDISEEEGREGVSTSSGIQRAISGSKGDLRRGPRHTLVLMDVAMPGMDGLTATREIQATVKKPPWIVALTASAMEDDRLTCLQSGMNDFVAKPVTKHSLVQMLERYVVATFGEKGE